MAEQEQDRTKEILELTRSVRKRLGALTVAVLLMVLAVFLCSAASFGELIEYHAGDGLLLSGIGILSGVAGFVLGFIAGRKV